MDVFDLVAKLSLDSSEYDKNLTGAEQQAQGFGSKFKAGVGTAMKVGGAAIAAVGAAAVATGSAIVKATGEVAAYGDNIDKMSQKMGISIEAYQEWDAVMQHSGTSMESLKASMKTMANAAENGNEAFQQLGISEEEVATLSQEDLFDRVITGLQNMEEGTERTYIASQLLGRGATELGALLNTSAEDTQAMKDRVRELGGVMSEEAVKAAAKYQDTLQDMQTGFESLKRNLLSEFLPGITTVMEGLTDLTTGNYDEGIEKIGKGVDDFIEKVTDKLPLFLEIGEKILINLATSITENLPKLVQIGANVIVMLINGVSSALPSLIPVVIEALGGIATAILNNLPILLTSILDLILQLANSILTQGLPMIIEMLPDFIVGIVDFILSASTQITEAVLDIVIAIAELAPEIITTLVEKLPDIIAGVINALLENGPALSDAIMKLTLMSLVVIPMVIVEIVKRIPEIFKSVTKEFKRHWPEMKQAGREALLSSLSGMFSSEIFNKMGQNIAQLMQTGLAKIKAFVSSFQSIGQNIMDGLINGIRNRISTVISTVVGVGDSIRSTFMRMLGIASPSKVFAQYGQFIDEGLAQGIDKGIGKVDNAMNTLTGSVLDLPSVNSGLYGNTDMGYNNFVEAITEAMIAAAPYFKATFNVNANKDRIVDIMVEANNKSIMTQGKGVLA